MSITGSRREKFFAQLVPGKHAAKIRLRCSNLSIKFTYCSFPRSRTHAVFGATKPGTTFSPEETTNTEHRKIVIRRKEKLHGLGELLDCPHDRRARRRPSSSHR